MSILNQETQIYKTQKNLIKRLFKKLPDDTQAELLKELKDLTKCREVYYIENCDMIRRFTSIRQIVAFLEKTLNKKIERGNIVQTIEGKRPSAYGFKMYKIKE